MRKIKKCLSCEEYTLQEFCRKCGERTVNPKPPRYSPEDRFGDYRRRQKQLDEK